MTRTFSRRRVQQAIVAAALVAVGLRVMAGAAYAHHGAVTAGTDCSGAVTYTVTDWKAFGRGSVNPDIRVAYRTSGGLITVADGAFGPGHTAFSGTFVPTPDVPGTLVQLEAEAVAAWGDGAPPGSTRSTSVTILAPCPTTTGPTTTIRPTPTTGPATTPQGSVLATVVTAAPSVANTRRPTLALTGLNITWGVALGILLILLGLSTLALGARSR